MQMKVRGWWFVVGGALALLLGISLSAQNRAAQAPIFEPDPLWAQALPEQVGDRRSRRHRGRFARQRLGLPPPGDAFRKASAARRSNPPAVRVLHSGAERCSSSAPTASLLQAWGEPGRGL